MEMRGYILNIQLRGQLNTLRLKEIFQLIVNKFFQWGEIGHFFCHVRKLERGFVSPLDTESDQKEAIPSTSLSRYSYP